MSNLLTGNLKTVKQDSKTHNDMNSKDVVIDPENVPEIDSKYRLILLVAQRAKQIQRGARPRVDMNPQTIKSTKIARAEFDEKKYILK